MDRLDAADVTLPHLRVKVLILAVIGVALMVACGGAAPSPGTPLPTSGRFTFSAQTGSGYFQRLEGAFEVVADTVLLQVSGAHCQPIPLDLDELGYQCTGGEDNVRVLFKRANPVQQPKALVTVRTPRNVSKCDQYGYTNDGSRICVQSSTEVVYVPRTQTLYLKPQAIP
jgi:hypothetical protein